MTNTVEKPVVAPAPAAPAAPAAAPVAAAPVAAPPLGAPDVDEVPPLGAPDAPDAPAADTPAAPDEKPPEYEFTPPEGHAPYREKVIDAVKTSFAKGKIAPDVAKQIVADVLPVIEADMQAQHAEHLAAQEKAGKAELETRHGARLPEVMRLANRFLARAASPALVKAIAESPLLRAHPDFIDMLAAGGQRFTNDRPSRSNGPAPEVETGTVEERLARKYDREAAIAQQAGG